MKPQVARPLFQERRNLVLDYNASGFVTQSALTNSNTAFFRMNSIYDPDYTNNTRNGLPSGYTTLTGIYQKYCVRACTVTFKLTNTGSFATKVILIPASDISATNFSTTVYPGQYATRNGAKSVDLTPATGSRSMATLKGYYKMHQVFGKTAAQYVSDTTTAFGSNPSNVAYLGIAIGTAYDGAQNAGNVSYTVNIRFHVTVQDVFDNIWNS